jgi:phospholipase/carboxylesterase
MFLTPRGLSFDAQFLPSYRFKAGTRSPYLTIVLHGMGDSSESFSDLDRELKISGMNYLLLNAPKKYLDGFSWYSLEPRHKKGIQDSKNFLNKVLKELLKQGWKSQNIFILGHSQGALMAAELAMTSGLRFAGVIGVSGYVYFSDRWQARIRPQGYRQNWMMTHGTRDRILPIRETFKMWAKLKRAGVEIEWREFEKGHNMDCRPENREISKWIKAKMESDLILNHANRKTQSTIKDKDFPKSVHSASSQA